MYLYLNTHAVNNRLHIEIHVLKSELILPQLVVKTILWSNILYLYIYNM